jgi:hypothetical protein
LVARGSEHAEKPKAETLRGGGSQNPEFRIQEAEKLKTWKSGKAEEFRIQYRRKAEG